MKENIRIVLVEPSHPGNIGGAARALKNMGLTDLCVVNPKRFPDPQAEWRAAGAQDVLENITVVDSVQTAVADCHLVMGTSTRSRSIPWPVDTADASAVKLVSAAKVGSVAVLFGRENSGLSNEELQMCHQHLVIPANPEYPSLNLAMAVQIVAYEIQKITANIENVPKDNWDKPAASMAEVEGFYEHLDKVLTDIDFHDPKSPRQSTARLRRLFNRIRPDETEIQMLRGILHLIETHSNSGSK